MKNKKFLIFSKKQIFQCIVLVALVFLYWFWLFFTTVQAEEKNTYECYESILNIEVLLASHRGTDKLFLYTQDSCYMLDMGWRNQNQTMDLFYRIKMVDTPMDFKIWKHISKYPFDIRIPFIVEEVVDLRTEKEVFWQIENHNFHQKKEFSLGALGGLFFFTIPIAIYIVLLLRVKHKSF